MLIATGVYFFYRSHAISKINTILSPTTEAAVAPVKAIPPPKPAISEETKAQLMNFLDKAGKLRAMTDQGLSLNDFRSQLSEVRGIWESISTFGLPQQLKAEERILDSVVSAWVLAQDLWSGQVNAEAEAVNLPGEDVLYSLRAEAQYGKRLDALVAALRSEGITIPDGAPDFSDKVDFEREITGKLFGMAQLTLKKMDQARGQTEIDFLSQQFQSTHNEVLPTVQKIFGKDTLPKRLKLVLAGTQNIYEIVRKIGEKEHSLRTGNLSEIGKAMAGLEVAKLNEQLVEIKKTVAEVSIGIAAGTTVVAPFQVSKTPADTRVVSPKTAVKWCLIIASSALDAAKSDISARSKGESEHR